MKITFHGAAQTVTGSKHLIETDWGYRVLLDCGLFQGEGRHSDELNRRFGFAPHVLDAVILSHAHIDHSGLLPRLCAEGFKGKIYCTPATKDLCEIMLADSAHIQELELKYLNRRRVNRGEAPEEPLYNMGDVMSCLNQIHTVPYGDWKQITQGVKFMFTDAGHLLGSAAVTLHVDEGDETKRLFFTADIGRPSDAILRNPETFPEADYIICESTYGNRLHPEKSDTRARLLQLVMETCVMNKGRLVIPAFSVDRTQELIFMLDQLSSIGQLPPIRVFVDSPLSVKATEVMRNNDDYFNPKILDYIKKDGDAFAFPNLTYISDVAQSKKLNTLKEPYIIISASGMAEAGRVKHHIAHNIEDPGSSILIVGYCTPSSLGGKLRSGVKRVKIFGMPLEVRARVEIMDEFSAHADWQEILEYLSVQNPAVVRKMFLVHGELEAAQALRQKLTERGFYNVLIPELDESIQL